MVAKLSYGNSIFGILVYNEDKVKTGSAKAILSANFSKDIDQLSFGEKHREFNNFTGLNTRVKQNAYHFMLSFSPKDMAFLTLERKKNIAEQYLKGLGLEDQPCLVYEHFDTENPHLHIVTTNITNEGKRIDIYRSVHSNSERIRKSLEIEHGLTIAEKSGIDIEKIPEVKDPLRYGKQPTKSSLGKAIQTATEKSKPSNLEELKRILSTYGITVDEGHPNSKQREKKGLVYGFIDKGGNRVGKAIKASQLYKSPTFNNLQKQFRSNNKLKEKSFSSTAKSINEVFHDHVKFTEREFKTSLHKYGITPHITRNELGAITDIFYKNEKEGTLFNAKEFNLDQGKLREKFGDYSLTKVESKSINKIIANAFREEWKGSKNLYESTFLRSLDKNRILEKVLTDNPDLNRPIVNDAFENYADYKIGGFEAIFDKDVELFNKRNIAMIRYVGRDDFNYNTDDKKAFLREFDLKIAERDGTTSIEFSRDPNINMRFNATPKAILKSSKARTIGTLKPYSKAERRLLHFLAERGNDHIEIPKDVNLYLYKNRNVAPYIGKNDERFIETTINRDYADKLTKLVMENKIRTVAELMDYGLLVEPLSNDKKEKNYVVRYHDNKREYSVPLKGELLSFVFKEGYNRAQYERDYKQRYSEHYDNFTLKYRLVSNLNRIGITKSYSGLVYAHKIISKRNEKAGNEISRFIEKAYQDERLGQNAQHEKIRLFMLEKVQGIQSKEIGKDHLKTNQINKAGKLRLTSDISDKQRLPSNYEEEERRRKMLMKFYNDLEL